MRFADRWIQVGVRLLHMPSRWQMPTTASIAEHTANRAVSEVIVMSRRRDTGMTGARVADQKLRPPPIKARVKAAIEDEMDRAYVLLILAGIVP